MMWWIVGAVGAGAAIWGLVTRQRARVWSTLHGELRALGLRPMGSGRGKQWQKHYPSGVVATVRMRTGDFGTLPTGPDLKERVVEVRRRRAPWKFSANERSDGLSLDPRLDELNRLQGPPWIAFTIPKTAREALNALVRNKKIAQGNGPATLWRWAGTWPPAPTEVPNLIAALQHTTTWAEAAQDPVPAAIRLLRTAQDTDLEPWVSQTCLLELEATHPGIADTASWATTPGSVAKALDALAALPDDQVPRSWRRAAASQLLDRLGTERMNECMAFAARTGTVATARFVIQRICKGNFDPAAEHVVCEALGHKSGTIQLLSAQTLADRGTQAALATLQAALESNVFQTPDNEMWARTAVTKIRARGAAA